MDRCLKDASQHLLCNATQEGIDRMLPAEFVTLQSPITQGGPEPAFRIGGIAAKFRCPLSHGGASKPSPTSLRSAPSPAVRERGYKGCSLSPSSCSFTCRRSSATRASSSFKYCSGSRQNSR